MNYRIKIFKQIKFIIIFLLFLPFFNYSQVCSYIENLDESKKICDFFKGNKFSSNQNAEIALNKVLNSIGASKTFILKECNGVNNASATSYKGVRYIFYNNEFMNAIVNRTDSWSNLSILAHEVGHHINGHTMDMVLYANDVVKPVSKKVSREMELEADFFSGFVMAKIGASLKQATQVMSIISSNADDTNSTHPAKNKRLSAITKGYKSGYVKPKVIVKTKEKIIKVEAKPKVLTYENYFYNGVSKYQAQDRVGALKDFNKSIQLNNKFAPSFHNRAILLDDLKRYKDAIDDYNTAIKLDPNNPLYYYNRAISKNNLEDYSGVVEDLNFVIKNDNTNITAIKFRGQSHFNLKNFNYAVLDFNKVIEFDNSLDEVYYLRGISKGFNKKHNGAVLDFNKAIKIDSTIIKYYRARSVSKLKLKDYKGSLIDYSKIIELDNKNIDAYMKRADVNYYLKNNDLACNDWTFAEKLGNKTATRKIKDNCRVFLMKKKLEEF